MNNGNLNLRLVQVAEFLNAKFEGPPDLFIARLTSIETGDGDGIAFAESNKFVELAHGKVAALVLGYEMDSLGIPCIRVENPRASFLKLLLKVSKQWEVTPGVHPTAIVHQTAKVHPTAFIGAFAFIESGSEIGQRAKIYPYVYVGKNCVVGENAVIAPHAVLLESVSLGSETIIHSGTIIGADGFGFFWDGEKHCKIPQVGRVEIGDRVEIGALTAIDRANIGATSIGTGTKIDNLVQIGHNCQIGNDSLLVAQVGIGGSAVLGSRVTLGGQSGTNDHVTIASGTSVGGGTAIAQSLPESGLYYGYPIQPFTAAVRTQSIIKRLPEIMERLKAAENKILELEAKLAKTSND